MANTNYIYTFKYDTHNDELCKLESRQIFGKEEKDNKLLSDYKVDPSISPFIKNRLEVVLSSEGYSTLLKDIKKINLEVDGFKAEYLVLNGDDTNYTERLSKLKDIGYCIEGDPDYNNPSIIYSICKHKHQWHFGILTKHNTDWFKHNKKPFSFSSAINRDIAKSLVSISSKGNKKNRLIDACCGVGTIMLEACISGFDIEGCDINWKACKHARANLAHYNYNTIVYRSDIKDVSHKYDSAIIDLPYNMTSFSDDANTLNIIASTAKLANRIVIVSTTDIRDLITTSGLKVADICSVGKKGKKFSRIIWVCEKEIEC